MHKDLLDVEVLLSNFENRTHVSVKEFLGIAGMILQEEAYRNGTDFGEEISAEIKAGDLLDE